MTPHFREAEIVVGILLMEAGQRTDGAVRSIERVKAREGFQFDITVQGEGQTALDFAEGLQAKYPGCHILLLHESVVVPSSFLESLRSQIGLFARKNVAWGVIGNSGFVFPYFKRVCNMLIAGAPTDRFAGTLPAAQLDPYVLLIHRDVALQAFASASGCPADAPISDLATLAAWEAEKPCWICNWPVYVDGSPDSVQGGGDGDAWARYLATRYNNASFVSSFGTIGLSGHAADVKDYYYTLMEPALNRATRHLDDASVTLFLFATYYDPDIFDRCLMSIASQFQRPETVYIIGLERLDSGRYAEFSEVVERYRHYLSIHWAEEELPEIAAVGCLREYLERVPDNGYSVLVYDSFVLFPQAVRQIREFLQITLRDEHVLPITTAEISRLHRTLEARFSSRPHAFFREVEKLGFSHKERWLSSEPSSTLHFTFPNKFLRDTSFAGIDLFDLGSSLPQRLLSEPLSFFLIERGAGYMSFQKPSPDETISPLIEAGTPLHLANKAASLMAAQSNVSRYAMAAGGIMPTLSYRDGDAASEQQAARLSELEAGRGQAELEIERLRGLVEQQEQSLTRLRSSWYFRARRQVRSLKILRGLFKTSRRNQDIQETRP